MAGDSRGGAGDTDARSARPIIVASIAWDIAHIGQPATQGVFENLLVGKKAADGSGLQDWCMPAITSEEDGPVTVALWRG